MKNDHNSCLSCRMSKILAGGKVNDHDQVTNWVRCHLFLIESPVNVYSRSSNQTEENQRWANTLYSNPILLNSGETGICLRPDRFCTHKMFLSVFCKMDLYCTTHS